MNTQLMKSGWVQSRPKTVATNLSGKIRDYGSGCALATVVLMMTHSVSAVEFTVSGVVRHSVILVDGRTNLNAELSFVASVRDGRWLIRTFDPRRPDRGNCEQGWDGKDLYRLDVPPEDVGKILNGPKSVNSNHLSKNYATGGVFPHRIPVPDVSLVAPVWLAYASGSHLHEREVGSLSPVWPIPISYTYLREFTYEIAYSLWQESPYLPLSVVFINSGWKLKMNTDSTLGKEPRAKPFDAGYTNALYEVVFWTNLNGLKLPMESKLLEFRPKPGAASSSDLIIASRIDLTGTSFDPVSHVADFKPAIRGVVDVVDYRVGDTHLPLRPGPNPYISYRTNTWLHTTNSVVQEIISRDKRAVPRLDEGKSPSRRKIIIFLLWCSTALLISALVLRARSKRDQRQIRNDPNKTSKQ